MCGISGIIASKESTHTEEFLSKSLKQLAFLSESRAKVLLDCVHLTKS